MSTPSRQIDGSQLGEVFRWPLGTRRSRRGVCLSQASSIWVKLATSNTPEGRWSSSVSLNWTAKKPPLPDRGANSNPIWMTFSTPLLQLSGTEVYSVGYAGSGVQKTRPSRSGGNDLTSWTVASTGLRTLRPAASEWSGFLLALSFSLSVCYESWQWIMSRYHYMKKEKYSLKFIAFEPADDHSRVPIVLVLSIFGDIQNIDPARADAPSKHTNKIQQLRTYIQEPHSPLFRTSKAKRLARVS